MLANDPGLSFTTVRCRALQSMPAPELVAATASPVISTACVCTCASPTMTWRWLSDGRYQHVSAQVAEIGRLLGGWIKQAGP